MATCVGLDRSVSAAAHLLWATTGFFDFRTKIGRNKYLVVRFGHLLDRKIEEIYFYTRLLF